MSTNGEGGIDRENEKGNESTRETERDPREPSSEVVQKVYVPGLSTLRFPVNTIAKLVDGRFCTCAGSVCLLFFEY